MLCMEATPVPCLSVPSTAAGSRLGACLQRCAAAGLRVLVIAPNDVRRFERGLGCFPDRRVDPPEHARWETAHRVFCGRGRAPHDRGSWLLLVVDADDRVMGAITARFFCGEIVHEYLHVLSLLEATGPVLREHGELALAEVFTATTRAGRTPAEISHWGIAPDAPGPLVSITLWRALGALAAAFDSPIAIVAADHHRGDVARLMRLGGAPLGCAGKFALPPFVHHPTGAWLRLLLVDQATVRRRDHHAPAADLALLRARCPVISAG